MSLDPILPNVKTQNFRLFHGDCLDVLKSLPDNSIDSLITDPPAGIAFMNKEWDQAKGGREQWIAWMKEIMQECLRVLKPGAHGLVWALPKTSHWTATALEDAGFEIRDVISHIQGQGFPKSLNISKAIDKAAGVIGGTKGDYANETEDRIAYITAPATPEAKEWSGWGTSLKPSHENWILVRTPISEKTVAANVLKHGCGGLNVDQSRIATKNDLNGGEYSNSDRKNEYFKNLDANAGNYIQPQGRFPSHTLFSHHPDCVENGTKKIKNNSGSVSGLESSRPALNTYGEYDRKSFDKYCDLDGTETLPDFQCVENCPIRILDKQSGACKTGGRSIKTDCGNALFKLNVDTVLPEDNGSGASRFFKCFTADLEDQPGFYYCSKASGKDKNVGCGDLPEKESGICNASGRGFSESDPYKKRMNQNTHPTVKSTRLMSYLCKLVTPPNGYILDPFTGSGSTGVSALREGFKFIGIEKELDYFNIAHTRILHEESKKDEQGTISA